jgi:hypothetical protein
MRAITTPSYGTFTTLHEVTRNSALADFAYFANHVLSLELGNSECDAVQSAVMEQAPARIPTKRPNALASAVALWLKVRGHVVITPSDTFDLANHETLQWLFTSELNGDGSKSVATIDHSIEAKAVRLTWSKLS